ncbi:hypothetical protein [Microvirga sp. G4-2]|uniref:hypothetical protein n=1 Tax=Microvirga sp. G4-2 TaxID=3434467 RepID=UPI004044AD11
MIYQIEHVARAFYDAAHDDDEMWENAPETLKEEFRLYAREAITLLYQHRERNLAEALYSVASLAGPIELSKVA